MNEIAAGLITAFSMYSVIPMPKIPWKRENIRFALCFFPLIGVVIFTAVVLWYRLSLHFQVVPALFAAVAVLLPIILSGGIHIDGLIDTADAISSHAVVEKKQEILKDVHAGAFGVLFCAGYLLLSFGLWQQLVAKPKYIIIALMGYVASRAYNALSIAIFPTARKSGLVYMFSDSAARYAVVLTSLAVLAVMLIIAAQVSVLWGIVAAVASIVYFFLHRRFCIWEFGGNSGDLAGFLLVNMELLFLTVAVIGGLVG